MIKFKDFFEGQTYHRELDDASVELTHKKSGHTLFIKFDSKDVILRVTYTGKNNPWLTSMCALLTGKTLNQALQFNWKSWEEAFQNDQAFWDYKHEMIEDFFHLPLELLHGALDVFRGREYLYQETGPLICRCFGIRESDILEHLQKNETPTLESLSGETKAGMGCRTCVPQLKRWVALHDQKNHKHYFKDKAVSEWMLEIDYMLSCFPESQDWKMELMGMKDRQVQISFDKKVSQREEEEVAKRLQDFLGAALDPELAFFLRAARHFSKAKG